MTRHSESGAWWRTVLAADARRNRRLWLIREAVAFLGTLVAFAGLWWLVNVVQNGGW